MKPTLPKETHYSLENLENYKSTLNADLNTILFKYRELVISYICFSIENMKFHNPESFIFLLLRGFDTITNVFFHLLYYTKNVDLTLHHCQKAYFFYVEFIEQISEAHHVYLQLNSVDAVIYVYKKTLFEINNDSKKGLKITPESKENFSLLQEYSKAYKSILEIVLYHSFFDTHKKLSLQGEHDGGIKDTGIKDTGIKDTGIKNTGIKDTGIKDTGIKDTGIKDTGIKNTGIKDTETKKLSELANLIKTLTRTLFQKICFDTIDSFNLLHTLLNLFYDLDKSLDKSLTNFLETFLLLLEKWDKKNTSIKKNIHSEFLLQHFHEDSPEIFVKWLTS
jgi:hypothetical protein